MQHLHVFVFKIMLKFWALRKVYEQLAQGNYVSGDFFM